MSVACRLRRGAPRREDGFTVVELMMAMVIMVVVMTSLTLVLVNSVVDTAYNRQRNQAITLANQAIEEVRGLGWATIQQGTVASDLSNDLSTNSPNPGNVYPTLDANLQQVYCFQNEPMDVGGAVGSPQGAAYACQPVPWHAPACLTVGPVGVLPTAANLQTPAPLSPHQKCYQVNNRTYAVDVYLTGGNSGNSGPAVPPLSLTVVVSWTHPARGGTKDPASNVISDHFVTTTQVSSCAVGTKCL